MVRCKHVVEYSVVNPAYAEGRAMRKLVVVFMIILMVLAYVF
ncbi:membrane protein [Salmonella phage SPLA2]|uniref:Uncharacterized protein n=1 Tax=Salmonella phage brunost TaxID=2713287 RepID=A0A6G8RB79_9CAUD|nr:hypothetical protein vBSalMLPSEYT_00009 [Salmonella phage vB_SalM-LPSEYT]QIN98680.1 hypothetical protein brunost_17 [Salmonella phage brunost]WNT47377.1 membrane protein [Salmonella phage SPLA12]WNT47801.1 membrane protein [Salmonella phage SPLA2]WNT48773.1 membrane protein [Salmonella phage SPLA9]